MAAQAPEARLGGRVLPVPAERANPGDEWNTTELAVDGGRLVGYLDGERVLDLERDGWRGEVSVSCGSAGAAGSRWWAAQ